MIVRLTEWYEIEASSIEEAKEMVRENEDIIHTSACLDYGEKWDRVNESPIGEMDLTD